MLTAILTAIPAVKMICLDVANGYSQAFIDTVRPPSSLPPAQRAQHAKAEPVSILPRQVRAARQAFPTHSIAAGNVVTGEMVEELILSGADMVKVGIGPGSVCTTRRQTYDLRPAKLLNCFCAACAKEELCSGGVCAVLSGVWAVWQGCRVPAALRRDRMRRRSPRPQRSYHLRRRLHMPGRFRKGPRRRR